MYFQKILLVVLIAVAYVNAQDRIDDSIDGAVAASDSFIDSINKHGNNQNQEGYGNVANADTLGNREPVGQRGKQRGMNGENLMI